MNKITKKLLLDEINKINQRLDKIEDSVHSQDRMITELNHALPDPDFDAKCEEQFNADCESLDRHAVRLGLAKPKPDIKVGNKIVCTEGLNLNHIEIKQGDVYAVTELHDCSFLAEDDCYKRWFDFEGSEIRYTFTKENYAVFKKLEEKLTASEIALAWLGKQRYTLGRVSDESESDARLSQLRIIEASGSEFCDVRFNQYWKYCVIYDYNGNEITELPEVSDG